MADNANPYWLPDELWLDILELATDHIIFHDSPSKTSFERYIALQISPDDHLQDYRKDKLRSLALVCKLWNFLLTKFVGVQTKELPINDSQELHRAIAAASRVELIRLSVLPIGEEDCQTLSSTPWQKLRALHTHIPSPLAAFDKTQPNMLRHILKSPSLFPQLQRLYIEDTSLMSNLFLEDLSRAYPSLISLRLPLLTHFYGFLNLPHLQSLRIAIRTRRYIMIGWSLPSLTYLSISETKITRLFGSEDNPQWFKISKRLKGLHLETDEDPISLNLSTTLPNLEELITPDRVLLRGKTSTLRRILLVQRRQPYAYSDDIYTIGTTITLTLSGLSWSSEICIQMAEWGVLGLGKRLSVEGVCKDIEMKSRMVNDTTIIVHPSLLMERRGALPPDCPDIESKTHTVA